MSSVSGTKTTMFSQNDNDNRTVKLITIDLKDHLTGGTISVYRPALR
jgi:hypothetical protein